MAGREAWPYSIFHAPTQGAAASGKGSSLQGGKCGKSGKPTADDEGPRPPAYNPPVSAKAKALSQFMASRQVAPKLPAGLRPASVAATTVASTPMSAAGGAGASASAASSAGKGTARAPTAATTVASTSLSAAGSAAAAANAGKGPARPVGPTALSASPASAGKGAALRRSAASVAAAGGASAASAGKGASAAATSAGAGKASMRGSVAAASSAAAGKGWFAATASAASAGKAPARLSAEPTRAPAAADAAAGGAAAASVGKAAAKAPAEASATSSAAGTNSAKAAGGKAAAVSCSAKDDEGPSPPKTLPPQNAVGTKRKAAQGAAADEKEPAPGEPPRKVVHRNPREIKDEVHIQKMSVLAAQLMKELNALSSEEQQRHGIEVMMSRFCELTQQCFLAQMCEEVVKFFNSLKDEYTPIRDESSDERLEEEEMESFERKLKKEQESDEDGTKAVAKEEEAEEGKATAKAEDEDRNAEAAHQLLELTAASSCPKKEWPKVWQSDANPLREDEVCMLGYILEVPMDDTMMEHCAVFIQELLNTRTVEMRSLEAAMEDFASRLEELVQENEGAWQILSYILLVLFPWSNQSKWGLLLSHFKWETWWEILDKVLSKVEDRFRAFDILVFLLLQMQERAETSIHELPVWKFGSRLRKLEEILCKCGSKDIAGIENALDAWGVHIKFTPQ
eukprot:TRINITY_DN4012_c0_g1_i1.p1 TRINITY_DN4012_c0_g1~~TRINITY_DN4012_c0_g1_i1.p1  ORF type:complete len:684 (+),score=218.66 TRINITY_DN4012_c0_g1_i1:53-2104(+)